jgi:hypothetical protein
MQLFKKNLIYRRNDKPLKTNTQCGEAGDRIPIMTSDITISAFLPIELGFVNYNYSI